jgi:beta-glucosidase
MKAGACAKHFAVHSGPEAGRLKFSVGVSERDLREYYLPAFRALVEDAKVETVMSSYNALNGVPMTANRRLLTDILRGEWGFRGAVVSDAGATDYLVKGHRIGGPVEAVARAAGAGLDLGIDFVNTNLAAAVRGGFLSEAELDRNLMRVFSLRLRLGLSAGEERDRFGELGAEDVATGQARALALECAEKSLVLVSNRGNALPLDREKTRAICVLGPRAVDAAMLHGNYNGYSAQTSCIINGFAEEAGAGTIVRDRSEWFDEPDRSNDAWIVCVGITPDLEGEGEGGDRVRYGLDARQLALLRRIRERAPEGKIVTVVFGGSPIDLRPLEELSDAVMVAWYPGEAGGRAVARAVFGAVNPAGRLPVTYPVSYGDLPPFASYAVEGRTYRYCDKRPHHPFGYGLSYTTFSYSDAEAADEDGRTAVKVKLANAGKCAGDEVVQLYLRSPAGSGDRRVHHLAGFRRVRLAAGEAKTVLFELPPRAFEVFREDGTAFVPAGVFTAFVGGGQPGFAPGVAVSIEKK